MRARLVRHAGAVALIAGLGLLPAVAHAQPASLGPTSVRATVLDMSPTTPVFSADERPLTVRLRLTNTTDQPLYDLAVGAVREAPVVQRSVLQNLFANPQVIDAASPLSPVTVRATLAPHASTTLTYRTATSAQVDASDICLCLTGIYPIDFTVTAAAQPQGGSSQVGFAQTYLPSFTQKPQPVQVGWLWPLIDRPHRTVDSTVFTDDDLAASVSAGGRLDRALRVVEDVEPKVRLTLVIDPELIDELVVMTGRYQVQAANGKLVSGTGAAAARSWLARLRAVLATSDVTLTPPADPDVDALTGNGLTWTTAVDEPARSVLGSALGHDLAWPAGGAVRPDALRALVSKGASTVVLSDQAAGVTGQQPDALAQLPYAGAVAVVTDSTLQPLVSAVVTRGGSGAGELPQLVSDLAIRAAAEPWQTHFVALAPGRYVDPDPATAARAVLATSTPEWATPMTIRHAAQTITPTAQAALNPGTATGDIAQSIIDQATESTAFAAALGSALSPASDRSLLGDVGTAVQRCESSAWRVDAAGGLQCADDLDAFTTGLRDGVAIVQPSNGSYTLASSSGPLFVTLVNKLPVAVTVRLVLSTVNGVVGFHTDPIGERTIQANARLSMRVDAHVQRSGHFLVDASLQTPTGAPIGNQIRLSVHSTALGTIGVVITSVAGGVLLVALLVRLGRRLRRHMSAKPTAPSRVEVKA